MSTDNKKQFQYIDGSDNQQQQQPETTIISATQQQSTIIKTNDEQQQQQQFQIPNRLKHEFSPPPPLLLLPLSSDVAGASISPSSSKQLKINNQQLLIKEEQFQEDICAMAENAGSYGNQCKEVIVDEGGDGGDDDDDDDGGGGTNNKEIDKKFVNYCYPSIVVHHYQTTTEQFQQTNQKIQFVASTIPSATANNRNVYGRLSYNDDILYISDHSVEIGRNSSTSSVHFHVGRNSFVSRKHLQMIHDPVTNEFYLNCLSKNGIFVDDVFQRKSTQPLKLTSSCNFRFPSTNIRIYFESFLNQQNLSTTNYQQQPVTAAIEQQSDLFPPPTFQRKHLSVKFDKIASTPKSILMNDNSITTINNVIYAPLKISIPDQMTDKKSPFPSPTGTISAANSCPTSPRQSFQEYHHNHHHHHQQQQQQHQHNLNQYSSNYQNNNDQFIHPPQSTEIQTTTTLSSTSSKLTTAKASSSSLFNDFDKPPYSYAQLIVQSISAATDKQLTLSGIYSFISKNYPYYRKEANKGWQNSIRHNLSLNRYFLKVARSQDEPGKGSFWRIDPNSETKLIDQSYKKRRQRGNQCFRTPYGMPRSAPVSPRHNESSRSPVQDIVLQSAPGSPGAPYHINHDNCYVSQSMVSPSNFQYRNQQQYLTNSTIIKSHLVDIYEDQHAARIVGSRDGDRASSGNNNNNNNNDGRDLGLMSGGDDDYIDEEDDNIDDDDGDDNDDDGIYVSRKNDIDCDDYDNSHVLTTKRTKFD